MTANSLVSANLKARICDSLKPRILLSGQSKDGSSVLAPSSLHEESVMVAPATCDSPSCGRAAVAFEVLDFLAEERLQRAVKSNEIGSPCLSL